MLCGASARYVGLIRWALIVTVCAIFSATPCTVSAEPLSAALDHAYRSNPRLEAARATLRATNEDVARANALLLPTGSLQADATRQFSDSTPESVSNGASSPRGYSINLLQSLYRGGRTINQIREAEATVKAGLETLRTTEQAVFVDVVTAYSDVLRDEAILRIRENAVKVLTEELRTMKLRYSVREVTKSDLAQTEARHAAAVSQLDLARANDEASRGTYQRHVGRAPFRLVEPRVETAKLPRAREDAIQIAYREHPLVLAAVHRDQAARHTTDRIYGEMLPSVDLSATHRFTQEPSPITGRQDQSSIMARLTQPFPSPEVHARIRQSKQTQLARGQEIEQSRNDVRATVVQAWSQLTAARAQVASDNAALASFGVALSSVRDEAKAGQRTQQDVLNAEQDVLNAQVQVASTKRNIVVSSYTLMAAMGRLGIADVNAHATANDTTDHLNETRRKWFGVTVTRPDGKSERFDFWRHETRVEGSGERVQQNYPARRN